MPDPAAEARIRDLKRRLELDPGSRLFVALAEEYRKRGRIADALSTLQKGLLAHPNYLSAQVALGRAYLEAGQITDAIATFSKTLAVDPGNLVSARSLADIYLSRGESVEAIKKFKLYRALSGDRRVGEIIERLEVELAPPPPPPGPGTVPDPPPPPTFFEEKRTGPVRLSRDARFAPPVIAPALTTDPFDETSVKFEPDDSFGKKSAGGPPFAQPDGPDAPEGTDPHGRVLADLYFAQGHYTEALRIYDDLVAGSPLDEDLKRMRREAEARLLPAGSTPGAAGSDPGLEHRLGKIRALKRWLSVVQTG